MLAVGATSLYRGVCREHLKRARNGQKQTDHAGLCEEKYTDLLCSSKTLPCRPLEFLLLDGEYAVYGGGNYDLT